MGINIEDLPEHIREQVRKKCLEVEKHGKVHNIAMKPIISHSKMNKLEGRYRDFLEIQKSVGEIIDYKYEPFGLRMAPKTFYHPDFLVVLATHFEIHETKGFLRDDANVKFKTAAELFPWFKFKMIFWDKKEGWIVKEAKYLYAAFSDGVSI